MTALQSGLRSGDEMIVGHSACFDYSVRCALTTALGRDLHESWVRCDFDVVDNQVVIILDCSTVGLHLHCKLQNFCKNTIPFPRPGSIDYTAFTMEDASASGK